MSERLQQRLTELHAADSLDEISHLPPPRLHELAGNRKGQYSIDLVHPYRLIFICANDNVEVNDKISIDKKEVTEIEIIEIVDPH